MSRLHNKCVVITGASGGIGKEIAKKAAEQGARVVLLARNTDKLEELRNELNNQYGDVAYAYTLDVSDMKKIVNVFTDIYAHIGEIDVLVNNAGYGTFKEVDETDTEEIQAMFRVNVIGLMACTKMVVPAMKRRKSGHIINVASMAGKIATPKSTLYSSTKFAVIGYSNALRLELMRDGIRVTTVNPGPIQTNFFDIADESGTYVKNIEKFILQPAYVADKIVAAMLTKKREINLPRFMNAISKMHTLFPNTVETLGKNAFFKK
ncbi:SDR family NAD(P)-dependent oxidoreductase [Peribacillus loiseleuriae]|uniref:Oxidoreductase n=1 Tax=Peribacillus loiseleuriae TaxID=1679170 RepID=A0A0K9GVH1_9BACI|nr:SDR family oxidoreductase [Peribacillus loiseleuriae]KMY50689.1 oxidoreductase [Peribacillus loiseleuriae]